MHGKPRLFWLAGGLVANLGDWEELQSLEVRLEEFAVQVRRGKERRKAAAKRQQQTAHQYN